MTLRSSRRRERGAALLPVMLMALVALSVSAGLLMYASEESNRARSGFRPKEMLSCSESGLQYARSFFGYNYSSWGTYLAAANMGKYNIMTTNIGGTSTAGVADLSVASNVTAAMTLNPELFGDIDGDGVPDFYIYMRDNVDDFPTNDPTKDNDEVVIIGSVCINARLKPKQSELSGNMGLPGLEAVLVHSANVEQYGNATGTNNANSGVGDNP